MLADQQVVNLFLVVKYHEQKIVRIKFDTSLVLRTTIKTTVWKLYMKQKDFVTNVS